MSISSVAGNLLLGRSLVAGTLEIADGRIARIRRGKVDRAGLQAEIVAPGFIDLQVNGGFGAEFGTDPAAYTRVAGHLPATGVTSFLPTLVSAAREFYPRAIAAFCAARTSPGARMLGMHIEGPLISVARKGAHSGEAIAAAEPELLDRLITAGVVRIVTVAPERPGVIERIALLTAAGITVSLGHSDADHDTYERGVDAGATMGTHLFNAMSPFTHRAPGVAGALLLDDRLIAGLIADGVHTHPAALALAVRAKGTDRIALISDMMSATGMPPGEYRLGEQAVTVDALSARLADGTLAGSILTMDAAVRNMVRWTGVGAAGALHMATAVPARAIGAESGRISEGLPADLVLLDAGLQVQATVIGGEIAFERGQR